MNRGHLGGNYLIRGHWGEIFEENLHSLFSNLNSRCVVKDLALQILCGLFKFSNKIKQNNTFFLFFFIYWILYCSEASHKPKHGFRLFYPSNMESLDARDAVFYVYKVERANKNKPVVTRHMQFWKLIFLTSSLHYDKYNNTL